MRCKKSTSSYFFESSSVFDNSPIRITNLVNMSLMPKQVIHTNCNIWIALHTRRCNLVASLSLLQHYRRVHNMKVMCIESELICIVYIHTECALTTIRIEWAFSQSISIGGLKPVWKWIASWREIMQVLYFCMWLVAWRNKRSGKKWQALLCCFVR